MIIETIIGNIESIDAGSRKVEKVHIRSDDLLKRVQRVTTDHSRELGIRLSEAHNLADGDVLYMDDNSIIVLNVMQEKLLVIRPDSIKQMGEIAHQLGNRHLPAQFDGDEMLVQYDYLVEELLIQTGVPYIQQDRKVRRAFRHVGHKHG